MSILSDIIDIAEVIWPSDDPGRPVAPFVGPMPLPIPPGTVVPVTGAEAAKGPRYMRYDFKLGKWVPHKHRRRRRRLLTDTDFDDLNRIGLLKQSDNVKVALAKAIRR